jgi:hypothetical protein
MNKLKRRIAFWKFCRGIGKLTRQYQELSQDMERTAFLMEHFGRQWQECADAMKKEQDKRHANPT